MTYKRDDRADDWDGYDMATVHLPYEVFEKAVEEDLSTNGWNILLYMYFNYDAASGRVNIKSKEQIAHFCKIKMRQVYKGLAELKKKGLYLPLNGETALKGTLTLPKDES